jgi:NitT/TauT family transport system substrate-binding protein
MKVSKVATTTAVICIAALALAGCSSAPNKAPAKASASASDCGPLTEMTNVSLGINPGSQSLITTTMKDQGLDKKYNLNVEVKDFLNPPAAATAVTQKTVDIGYGGVTTMAIARAQGSDVVFFGPFITTPQDGVFVLKDSQVHSLADLKGKKIGSFSGTSSATTALLSAIAAKTYDMPKLGEISNIVVAPAPALFGLLDKGNVDAVLTVDTDSVNADLSGKYKKILDLSEGYKKAFGTNPMFVGLVSTDSYAKANCSTLKAFSKAQSDTVEYVKSHDSAWTDYAQQIKMTDPAAPKALQKLSSSFTTGWDATQVKSVTGLLESMIPILGAKHFVSAVPQGLFSLDYWTTK